MGEPAFSVKRTPWGESLPFEMYGTHDAAGVLWTLDPLEELSLQYHLLRREVYRLMSGSLRVFRGPLYENDLVRTVAELSEVAMRPSDILVIPPRTVHCPVNQDAVPAEVMELSDIMPYNYADIVRIHDKHGRATFPGFRRDAGIQELVEHCRQEYARR